VDFSRIEEVLSFRFGSRTTEIYCLTPEQRVLICANSVQEVAVELRRTIVSGRSLPSVAETALEVAIAESGTTPAEAPDLLVRIKKGIREVRAAESKPDVMSSPQDRMGSLIQSFAADYGREFGNYDPAAANGLEVKFDEHDAGGWFLSLFDWLKQFRKRELLPSQAFPTSIRDGARLALFADWGTGLYGAPVISNSIAQMRDRLDLVCHLGDVYYAGTKKEEKARLQDLWPSRNDAVNRTCNSNHEMYSGGEGYFDIALPFIGQESSSFVLESSNWIIVGLDSAYEDHQLAGTQVAWLTSLIAGAPGKKVVLLSHHQPFSLLDAQGPNLVAQLQSVLSAKQIFAWYWGHEHRCVLYDKRGDWNLWGRCIGHGGFPQFRDHVDGVPAQAAANGLSWKSLPATPLSPSGRLLDGPNANIPEHADEYGPHGFLTLELFSDRIQELVYDADGTIVADNTLR
jgi:hypothetical protein